MRAILEIIFKIFMVIYRSQFNRKQAIIYSLVFILLSFFILAWFFIIIISLFSSESDFFNFLNFINFNRI